MQAVRFGGPLSLSLEEKMKIDLLLSRLTIMVGTLVKQLRGHIHEQLERIENKSVNRPKKHKIKEKVGLTL